MEDSNLLDNFLEELHKATREYLETRSFSPEEFVNYMFKQFDEKSDSYILDQIAETKAPDYFDKLSLAGLVTFLGVTLETWFSTKIANWKDIPPDFKEKMVLEVAPYVVLAFLVSSGADF